MFHLDYINVKEESYGFFCYIIDYRKKSISFKYGQFRLNKLDTLLNKQLKNVYLRLHPDCRGKGLPQLW